MFLDKTNAKAYEQAWREGFEHEYPNVNTVRCENWFLKDKRSGKVLDYGFGYAEEVIYFARKGYQVWGLDVSPTAAKRGRAKLKKHNLRANLGVVDEKWDKLPFPDNFFDIIHSSQCIYYLADIKKIEALLSEFRRVLKPDGKIYISTIGKQNSIIRQGKESRKNIYKSVGDYKSPIFYYVFPDIKALRKSFSIFNIVDIGSFNNIYCGVNGFQWLVLAKNKK